MGGDEDFELLYSALIDASERSQMLGSCLTIISRQWQKLCKIRLLTESGRTESCPFNSEKLNLVLSQLTLFLLTLNYLYFRFLISNLK